MKEHIFIVRWEHSPIDVLEPKVHANGAYKAFDRRHGENAVKPIEVQTLEELWKLIVEGFAVRMSNGSTFDPKNHKFFKTF